MTPSTSVPVLLGAYPAKQCAHRTHLQFTPAPPVQAEPGATTQRRRDDGRTFEARVRSLLAGQLGDDLAVIDDGTSSAGGSEKERRVAETLAAMDRGAFMIAGGQLPDDEHRHRTGSPDLLLCAGRLDGTYRYLPVDVKHHRTLATGKGRSAAAVVSSFADPLAMQRLRGVGAGKHRRDDTFQLAHYTRMLEAAGRHPGERWRHGAIIGTSDVSSLGDRLGDLVLTWYDLAKETEVTWAPETGTTKVSILDAYDREFARRVAVAQSAREGVALTRAIGKDECSRCPFVTHCVETAAPGEASFAITSECLTEPEWAYLHDVGAGTVSELAELNVTARILDGFRVASGNHGDAARRLATAQRRAVMHRDGVILERTGNGPVIVPAADVEIDFDIEWDADERVYLWGVLVQVAGQPARYWGCHDFTVMDDVSEAALAERFFAWLTDYVAGVEAQGRTVMIYHWTSPETTRSHRAWPASKELFSGRTCDLHKVAKRHFFARDGLSVKVVARAFGFSWASADAGGAESTTMIERARLGDAKAAAWLLEYNRDDVLATAAVRDGLRALGETRQVRSPGA